MPAMRISSVNSTNVVRHDRRADSQCRDVYNLHVLFTFRMCTLSLSSKRVKHGENMSAHYNVWPQIQTRSKTIMLTYTITLDETNINLLPEPFFRDSLFGCLIDDFIQLFQIFDSYNILTTVLWLLPKLELQKLSNFFLLLLRAVSCCILQLLQIFYFFDF